MRYTAGQFTELTLPHDKPDDRGSKRWFTLSSSPSNELVSITTKYAGDDASSSFKQALFTLDEGALVDLAEAMGDFVMPKLTQTPLIFVAGGIGITPFHSMFEWLLDTDEQRDIRFVYAVETEEDIVFQDVFDKLGVHTTITVNKPSPSWGGLRGHLEAETVIGIDKPTDDTLIYLSGPEPMLKALQTDFLENGIDKRQLVTDFFPGYKRL